MPSLFLTKETPRLAARILALAVLAGVAWPSSTALAQPIGTFRWQQQPYCNVLSLYVTQQGGQYTRMGPTISVGPGRPPASSVWRFSIPTAPSGSA